MGRDGLRYLLYPYCPTSYQRNPRRRQHHYNMERILMTLNLFKKKIVNCYNLVQYFQIRWMFNRERHALLYHSDNSSLMVKHAKALTWVVGYNLIEDLTWVCWSPMLAALTKSLHNKVIFVKFREQKQKFSQVYSLMILGYYIKISLFSSWISIFFQTWGAWIRTKKKHRNLSTRQKSRSDLKTISPWFNLNNTINVFNPFK